MALRARHVDQKARDFLEWHPEGVIVNLGCGLDTRFYRLDGGRLHLFDLDLPEVIDLKRQLLAETERYHFVASSVLDFDWMDMVQGSSLLKGISLCSAAGQAGGVSSDARWRSWPQPASMSIPLRWRTVLGRS